MPSRHPMNATLELTLRCNLKCKMCMFRRSDDDNFQLSTEELTAFQWENIAQQLCDAGTLNVLITGGEPFLRKDFCEIYSSIYSKGFLITVYTNATLMNDEILKTFQKYPPHRIGITFYGASNQTYKNLCGCENGFDRALSGAKMLATLPSAIDFRTTIVKDNFEEINAIEEIIKQEFDSSVIHSTTVFQGVRGGCMPVSDCRLSPKQTVDLLVNRTVEKIRAELPSEQSENFEICIAGSKNDFASQKQIYTVLGCSGGMESFTITYDGKLLGCQMLGEFYTNVLESGFLNAWQKWPFIVRLPKVNPACASCNHLDLCQVCPGVRMAECKDLTGKPEYVCQITNELLSRKGDEKFETKLSKPENELGTHSQQ